MKLKQIKERKEEKKKIVIRRISVFAPVKRRGKKSVEGG